jgi:hypothetical protein
VARLVQERGEIRVLQQRDDARPALDVVAEGDLPACALLFALEERQTFLHRLGHLVGDLEARRVLVGVLFFLHRDRLLGDFTAAQALQILFATMVRIAGLPLSFSPSRRRNSLRANGRRS